MARTKQPTRVPPDGAHENERLIGQNRKARHDYQVLDTLECGVVLVGSEVKSLRCGKLSLDEAYGRVRDGEVWLIGSDIQEYSFAHRQNHDPRRPPKLLLHRREIRKFAHRAHEHGLTLIPLRMYFKQGRAKVLLGLCRGRKNYDKREAMKQAAARRDIHRALRRGVPGARTRRGT
ncbi:MAG: SsrA-binding protein [Planctomycetes bacterium RBG_16_64_10]|nr:MAG: SsrA-binding protein [Planctomycetes bacterium RBG_16_64_10]